MRAALFLTRTKTQFDDHLTAESATLDTGATTTPSKDASVVPRVSTVSPRRTAATATIIAGPTTADAVGSGAQEPASTHSPTPAPSPATPHTQVQSTPSRFVSENLWPMSERSKAPGDTDPRIVSTSRAVQALVGNVPDINWQGIQSHDQTPSTASTPSRSYTSSKTGVMPSHQAESSGVTGSTDDSTGGSLRKPGIVEVAGLAFTPASSSSYVAPNGQTFGPGQTVYVGTADSPTPVVLTTDRGGSAVFIVGSSTVPVPSLQTLDIGGNIFAGLGGTPSPSSSTPDSDFEDQVDAAPGEGSIEETTESRPAPGTIVVGMASGAPNLIVPTGSSRTASVTPFTGAATALKVSCWLLVSTLLVVATL
ncbi:Hypothetical protein D9617_10g072180 [Elsinoe fawcettii]|nr:Hypothetical protein D9617_10g072180 [Elsinoe fawcettii]